MKEIKSENGGIVYVDHPQSGRSVIIVVRNPIGTSSSAVLSIAEAREVAAYLTKHADAAERVR